ncbi:MAG: lysine biosynthesis protein LysX [Thermorudis peleae]|mgnify:CR=1 FL=1|nr:lysine biosynthesis protein LysX [Thermorudis peleae]
MSSPLHIGILLSHVREEEKRLLRAFEARGALPVRLYDRSLIFDLVDPTCSAPTLDLVLDRCMAHSRGVVALRLFESMGVPTINTSQAMTIADDKVLTTRLLAQAGVPTLRTMVAFDVDSALQALDQLGYPAVIKPVTGSWGRLLARVHSPQAARSVLEHKRALGSFHHGVFYLQEYVEKPGRDLRVFVVGDDVIAASYRIANHWVTNVARGAISAPCPVTPDVAEIALRAAHVVGVEIAGIDLIETDAGLKVLEVNGGVEFKGLMQTTDQDIAGIIADYVLDRARGLRQPAVVTLDRPRATSPACSPARAS